MLVDVRYEARGGVEVCVGGFVGAVEGGRGVGEGVVRGGGGVGGCGEGGRGGWGCGHF